jgi:hypothetical protein
MCVQVTAFSFLFFCKSASSKFSFIHSSIAVQPFVGRWRLFQFRNLFTQTVEILVRVVSPPQGRYLHTGQHKHRINTHINIHVL